ncbi:MAG: hypothetical protein MK212_19345 [Saprospiraceae bacterium]|nr:hypothetical protein [Saprospiraceae bacterium]
MLEKLQASPKNIFIIDALGALLSAFLLGVVLVYYQSYFGIPKTTLYILAIFPCFFALYDAFAYWKHKAQNISQYIKGIALLNFLYCIISLMFAFYHLSLLTILGWLYIIPEMIIILVLASVEWRLAKRLI